MKKMLKEHAELISGIATIVQTVIAVLMLWTLIQNSQTLNVTTRQLEANVVPLIRPLLDTKGVQLTNDGLVSVRNVEITALVAVRFDATTMAISDYWVSGMRQPLIGLLPSGKSVLVPLESLKGGMISEMLKAFPPNNAHEQYEFNCVEVSYRRSADMKPFAIFLPFLAGKNEPFCYPMYFTGQGSGGGKATSEGMKLLEDARRALLTFYADKVAEPKTHD